jgi:DNA-binding protein H-NS
MFANHLVCRGRGNAAMTKKLNLDAMSVDEMWQLHEEISRLLSVRLTSEKRELEKRLEQLRRDRQVPSLKSTVNDESSAPRRKYPRVHPKYQNPEMPSETWAGRGKTPRWLVAALKTGRKLEEFEIGNPSILVRKQKNNAQNAR